MARPYDMETRQRAIARLHAGEGLRTIAASMNISPSCLSKWSKRIRERGVLAPSRQGGAKPKILSGPTGDWLRQRMKERPFTLRGLVAELAGRGVKVDYRSVQAFARNEGFGRKPATASSGSDRPDPPPP